MSIQADVDRGIEIRSEMEELKAQLKEIEARLTKAALRSEQIPLVDADREGRQFLAKGSTQTVPVIITADNIVASFPQDSALHMQLRDTIGTQLREFYKLTWLNRFRDGKEFRALARELLGDRAPALITACLARDKDGIPKNRTIIAWPKEPESP